MSSVGSRMISTGNSFSNWKSDGLFLSTSYRICHLYIPTWTDCFVHPTVPLYNLILPYNPLGRHRTCLLGQKFSTKQPVARLVLLAWTNVTSQPIRFGQILFNIHQSPPIFGGIPGVHQTSIFTLHPLLRAPSSSPSTHTLSLSLASFPTNFIRKKQQNKCFWCKEFQN